MHDHTAVKFKQLVRDLALIVILGNDAIRILLLRIDINDIGGQQSFHSLYRRFQTSKLKSLMTN